MGKSFVFMAALLLAVTVFPLAGSGSSESRASSGHNPLRIPELLDTRDNTDITLVMQNGSHNFYEDVASETKGFNGDYLGPTIRLYRDSEASITFINNLDEPTTIHGHGLHVNGEIDGGPQSRFMPGESWQITIPVQQEAGTSWYHPHLMGQTAEQVHAGLAGMYLIEDENSLSLDLPKEYGINDIPVIVQDRSFTDGRMNGYSIDLRQLIDGLREDTLVVNGTVDAYQSVPQGWVRLRLLNGSNSLFYRFNFYGNRPFYKIATEGGFLNEPVLMNSLDMAPGERNEIMIDLSNGVDITLYAELLPADPDDRRGVFERPVRKHVVELRVDPNLAADGTMPDRLNDIPFFDRSDATQIRTFAMEMDGVNRRDGDGSLPADYKNSFSINGNSMDMNFINEQVVRGEVEIWRITAERMPHPFHVHGASFQILTQQGKHPAETDRGWKDTIVVWNEVTEIIVRFDHKATDQFPYMYHCHMLEHEEGGMMGQFTVE